MSDPDKLMTEAHRAFEGGRPDVAEAILQQVLSLAPGRADVRVALGTVAAASGHRGPAMDRMREALKIDPAFGPALEWLAILCIQTGAFQEGEKIARRGQRIFPGNPLFPKILGRCLAEQMKLDQALAEFDRAVALQPSDPEAHFGRATALRALDRETEALDAVGTSVRLSPEPMALIEMAEIQLQMSRPTDALATCDRIAGRPADAYRHHLARARALTELGRGDEAEPHWREARRAERSPGAAYLEEAFTLAFIGRLTDALEAVKRSIELEPKRGLSYQVLFHARRAVPDDQPLIDRLESLARDESIDPADRVEMLYALGKARGDLGLYKLSLEGYDQANGLKKRAILGGRPFDRDTFRRFIDFQIDLFTKEALQPTGEERPDLPVFVVGMMRSGTTLVEQILSCHPSIGGAGEHGFWIDHVAEVVPGSSRSIDPAKAEIRREEYVSILRRVAPGSPHVIDKNPANLLVAGLLHVLFPSSRIVCTRRHAVDTALSIWMSPMRTAAPFICDRSDIVFAYKQALRLMDHWLESMPSSRYREVRYEDLTAEPQRIIPAIVDFCGLEWDEACLHPDLSAGVVRTPSFWQVRQPINQGSVDRWKRYEPWLGEFTELIGL